MFFGFDPNRGTVFLTDKIGFPGILPESGESGTSMESMTNDHTQKVLSAVDEAFDASVEELKSLVRIPSVAFGGFDPAKLDESASAVKALMESTGVFDSVRIERVPVAPGSEEFGQPAIIARREAAPGKPTVLLYAHHDVQPWGDEALWKTPPFEPTVIGDRLYGRGASDDKAGVMTHVAALRVLQQIAPDSGLGIALFIEGEGVRLALVREFPRDAQGDTAL